MSIGKRIPVEAFPPKIIAKSVTTTMIIPLIPDLESPTVKAAKSANAQLKTESWNCSGSSKKLMKIKLRFYQFFDEDFLTVYNN